MLCGNRKEKYSENSFSGSIYTIFKPLGGGIVFCYVTNFEVIE